MKNRAVEEWEKKDVMEKILNMWLKTPHLRLGQLIENAIRNQGLSHIEDYDLVNEINAFHKAYNINSNYIDPFSD